VINRREWDGQSYDGIPGKKKTKIFLLGQGRRRRALLEIRMGCPAWVSLPGKGGPSPSSKSRETEVLDKVPPRSGFVLVLGGTAV